jgi:alkylation response protein AidB-like acyl-CoA dehydrogenase
MRVISLEQSGRDVSTEASMLKIRGSEIQQDLGGMLLEAAGPNAIAYSPDWLEEGHGDAMPGGAHLVGLAAQYLDLRKVSIYGGTNEVQKNLIARAVVGL